MPTFKKALKITLWSLLGLTLVVIILSVGVLGYSAYNYSKTMAIETPNGINEAMYVPIGGTDQWIQIRGKNRDNPVLLVLNGGPGRTWIHMTLFFTPWEEDFTVVLWDQRGEGRSFEKSGPDIAGTMTIERMVQDEIEVSEFLRNRLSKKKIAVLGFSWGSALGVHMVKQRPDLFHAYVGAGQVTSMRKRDEVAYLQVLEKARAANNIHAIQDLEALGPPPYESKGDLRRQQRWEETTAKYPKEKITPENLWWSLDSQIFPKPYVNAGAQFSSDQLRDAAKSIDLPALGLDFELPIFIIQGTEDDTTPTVLAREYFEMISAPHKEFILIQDGGHMSVFNMREKILVELIARVRPFAMRQ